MNWRGICTELADRLAEHVPADDPLLTYTRQALGVRPEARFRNGEGNAVMTPEKVRELRRLRGEGVSYGRLAIRYGIDQKHAWRICTGKAWGWLK